LLESGRARDAVAAGERSVAADPRDGEAWLYLGAAYQEAGDRANAVRCYQACLTKATRGNKGECAAMLR
jgi:cytochrome c-type biogenesis protein CcmH/NrfG